MGLYTYDYLLSQKQAKGFHLDNPTNCCSLFLRTNLPWLVYLLGPIYQQLWPHEITTCQLIPSGMFLLPEISCRIKLYTKGPWLSRISTWKLTIKNITPSPPWAESPSLFTKTARWIWSLGGNLELLTRDGYILFPPTVLAAKKNRVMKRDWKLNSNHVMLGGKKKQWMFDQIYEWWLIKKDDFCP